MINNACIPIVASSEDLLRSELLTFAGAAILFAAKNLMRDSSQICLSHDRSYGLIKPRNAVIELLKFELTIKQMKCLLSLFYTCRELCPVRARQ